MVIQLQRTVLPTLIANSLILDVLPQKIDAYCNTWINFIYMVSNINVYVIVCSIIVHRSIVYDQLILSIVQLYWLLVLVDVNILWTHIDMTIGVVGILFLSRLNMHKINLGWINWTTDRHLLKIIHIKCLQIKLDQFHHDFHNSTLFNLPKNLIE